MRAQTIADVIQTNLKKLSNEFHVVRTYSDADYEKRIQNIINRHNNNVDKCSCFIGETEITSEQINSAKLKIPNFKPVVRYEALGSDDNKTNVSKFIVEVS